MVAAERVVQVEADNIRVRQAEVFTHCSSSWEGELRGKRSGTKRHCTHINLCTTAHTSATDMSMSLCVGGDGAAVCGRAARSLLTAP